MEEDKYQNYFLTEEDKRNIKELSPYQKEYTKEIYNHGKMYTYESETPYKDLVVTIADNGFGSGVSNSYVVLSVKKNKKGETKEATVALVIEFDENSLKYVDTRRIRLVQSGDKEGTWREKGDKPPYIYYILWGEIRKHDRGFDK